MATRKSSDNDSILGGVIDQVSRLTIVGRKTAADWVENVSPEAANLIRPESKRSSAKSSAKRTIKVTGTKSPTAKKAAAKKSPVKKATTAVKATARKVAPRSANRSASR